MMSGRCQGSIRTRISSVNSFWNKKSDLAAQKKLKSLVMVKLLIQLLVTLVEYLGITLDEDLSSESVATSVIRKVCGRLCFLYRQGHFLNERSRRTLCTALLQCHFDYCCSSWFSSLSTKLKNKLQVMQNKMVRFILKLGPRSHIGDEELKTVGMLRVEDRVRQLKRSTMKLHQST